MKKTLSVVLSAALAFTGITTLSGCKEWYFRNIEVTVNDETTLTILAKKSHAETPYIQKIFKLYEEKTGKKIQPIAIENDKFEETAIWLFDNGRHPDMLFDFNDSELLRFNVPQNFYPLNNEPWVDEVTDVALAYSKASNGDILGLPFWENSISGCFYNKKIFEECGLEPADTQGRFNELCKALKGGGYTPLYWAANDCNWMFQFGLDPVFADVTEASNGSELLQKLNNGEISYSDIPAVKDMIEWFEDAHKNGWFNGDYAQKGWDDISLAMTEGKAAMFFTWDTYVSELPAGKYSAEDFGLMPIFMGTTAHGSYEGGNLNLIMLNKNGKKLELAREFLRFCATPENYNSAFKGVVTSPVFKNQETIVQTQAVIDQKNSIDKYLRPSTAWSKIDGYKQNDVGKAIFELFEGRVDVEGCVRLMDKARLLAKSKA